MALLVSNVGSVKLLTELLTSGENWSLKLYKNNKTPAETDTAGSYTECDFTNYILKTLTRSVSGTTWSTPASASPTGGWSSRTNVANSTYGTAPQTWTCGTTGNTVYGYYLIGATSTLLILAELFATPRTLASGDTLSVQPAVQLG